MADIPYERYPVALTYAISVPAREKAPEKVKEPSGEKS
jgi:hypothetical protein